MQLIDSTEALLEQLNDWRQSGDHIALVPTMGNLHAGHLSLVALAREHAERVVVSVYVNPTQFAGDEEYGSYPRTLERDKRRAQRVSADLIFAPDTETMYPFGIENATSVTVPVLTDELCGSSRPGHFDGVTSIVSRLFSLVQPHVGVFGRKDFQQQMIIRRMVEDLNMPVEIVLGDTVRDEDGLALSSRNQYLDESERETAPLLYATLRLVAEELQSGKRNYGELEQQASERLQQAGFAPEYISIRRAANLDAPDRDSDELVILAAARLGAARLIDNVMTAI